MEKREHLDDRRIAEPGVVKVCLKSLDDLRRDPTDLQTSQLGRRGEPFVKAPHPVLDFPGWKVYVPLSNKESQGG